jgi:hypothetical protein
LPSWTTARPAGSLLHERRNLGLTPNVAAELLSGSRDRGDDAAAGRRPGSPDPPMTFDRVGFSTPSGPRPVTGPEPGGHD